MSANPEDYRPDDLYMLDGVVEFYDESNPAIAVTADPATDTFTTAADHGFYDGDSVFVAGGTLPAGLAALEEYFVKVTGAQAFQLLAARDAPAVIDITSAGAGVIVQKGFRDVGEIDEVSVTGNVSVKEEFTKRNRSRGKVKSFADKTEASVAITFKTVNVHNLKIALGATSRPVDGRRRLSLFQKPLRYLWIRITGTTDVGDFGVLNLPRVAVKPNKQIDLITSEAWKGSIDGSIEFDARWPGDEYGWFDVAAEISP